MFIAVKASDIIKSNIPDIKLDLSFEKSGQLLECMDSIVQYVINPKFANRKDFEKSLKEVSDSYKKLISGEISPNGTNEAGTAAGQALAQSIIYDVDYVISPTEMGKLRASRIVHYLLVPLSVDLSKLKCKPRNDEVKKFYNKLNEAINDAYEKKKSFGGKVAQKMSFIAEVGYIIKVTKKVGEKVAEAKGENIKLTEKQVIEIEKDRAFYKAFFSALIDVLQKHKDGSGRVEWMQAVVESLANARLYEKIEAKP